MFAVLLERRAGIGEMFFVATIRKKGDDQNDGKKDHRNYKIGKTRGAIRGALRRQRKGFWCRGSCMAKLSQRHGAFR